MTRCQDWREEPRFVGRRDGVTTVYFEHRAKGGTWTRTPLAPRFALWADHDFDWGYMGPRPENLAIALLCRYFEHVGLPSQRAGREALAVAGAFGVRVISQITEHRWVLTVRTVSARLAEIDAARHSARRKEASDV